MDISSITATERTFEARHPSTQEPIGLRITLRPMSSPEVEKVRRKNANQRLSGRNQKVTAEQLEANATELLVAAVVNWEWDEGTTMEGEQPECTEQNVRKVLNSQKWIRDQVDQELADDAAFFGN